MCTDATVIFVCFSLAFRDIFDSSHTGITSPSSICPSVCPFFSPALICLAAYGSVTRIPSNSLAEKNDSVLLLFRAFSNIYVSKILGHCYCHNAVTFVRRGIICVIRGWKGPEIHVVCILQNGVVHANSIRLEIFYFCFVVVFH